MGSIHAREGVVFTITRIGIASAFRVGLLVSAILAAFFGILLFVLPSLFSISLVDQLVANTADGANFRFVSAFSLAAMCVGYVAYVLISAIFGGIGFALSAFAYNLAARWVGGLELELAGESPKDKRSSYFE
jgi:hypothetical protein